MCEEKRFFICKHCGNLIGTIENSGVIPVCCGDPMTELVPNTVEASNEKHLPVISVSGNLVTVEVGSVEHPMVEEHFIKWVFIQTKSGGQRKCLTPGNKPKVTFALENDELVAAYEYCNLHGLWKTEYK